MTHCPVCGDSFSFFDRTHVREKHPEYFHAVRKWQLAYSASWFIFSFFIIISALSANSLVKGLALSGMFIALAFVLFTALKSLSVGQKFKILWKKNFENR